MSMRKHSFEIGFYYHIYNRGVDKRSIIEDKKDLDRFIQGLDLFNNEEPIGSIFEYNFKKNKLRSKAPKLVEILAYCVNPNHYHFILTPIKENGIEKFMQRIGGYSKYFNEKYKRSGALFQGKFKSKLIEDENYLKKLSSYVNMNNRDLDGVKVFELSKSSLEEYIGKESGLCDVKTVLDLFKDKKDFFEYVKLSWQETLDKKEFEKLN
jgi:putative transposase